MILILYKLVKFNVIITYYKILLIIDLNFTRSFKQVLLSLDLIKIVLFLINFSQVYLDFISKLIESFE
jgi:hypothetical protein